MITPTATSWLQVTTSPLLKGIDTGLDGVAIGLVIVISILFLIYRAMKIKRL